MGRFENRKVLKIVAGVVLFIFYACSKTETAPENQNREPENEVQEETFQAHLYTGQTFGRKTRYLFYDLKGRPKGLCDNAIARYVFNTIGMNGIRIPIYGDQANGGHPSEGDVGTGTYDNIISSIRNSLNFVDRDDLILFASKKLDGKTSFPTWVMDEDGINTEKYTGMIMDFLKYMKNEGIEIDVLGVDNEMNFNEGNIDPQRFHEIVTLIKKSCADENIKIPLFIGPELFVPAAVFGNSWLTQCYKSGLQDVIDIYGTHYYPQHHTATFRAALQHEFEITNSDRHREFWATEPHWDNNEAAQSDMLAHAEYAMCAMFDQTDIGMDMFCWWAFQYEGSLRAILMDRLSKCIFLAQPVRLIDHDGEDTMVMGKVQSRAFLSDDGKITAFFINMSGQDFKEYDIVIHDMSSFPEVSACQWTDVTDIYGLKTATKVQDDIISFQMPARSITEITIKSQNP